MKATVIKPLGPGVVLAEVDGDEREVCVGINVDAPAAGKVLEVESDGDLLIDRTAPAKKK